MTVSTNRKMAPALKRVTTLAQQFRDDEAGATAIEYALMLVMISVASIAAFKAVGGATGGGWGAVGNKVSSAMK